MSETDTDPDTADASSDSPIDPDGLASREYLLKGALVVLVLIAVFALFQFYTSMVATINEWVAPEFRPVFRAAFNLVVLLAAGIGISLTVRELGG